MIGLRFYYTQCKSRRHRRCQSSTFTTIKKYNYRNIRLVSRTMSGREVSAWSCQDVHEWLLQNKFSQYADTFRSKHRIDGQALLSLQEQDLRQPPLQIKVLGDIKRLWSLIRQLQEEKFGDSFQDNNGDCIDGTRGSPKKNRQRTKPIVRQSTSCDSEEDFTSEDIERFLSKSGSCSEHLEPEIFKTVLSFIYVFMVFLLTSFVMVVVHDRVPDARKYPPLPDLFLDNIPYIPWAFEACELVGSFLGFTWMLILFFHKHRFILMRRMFSMLGTVFLLRCVTMLITSMSVPGHHLDCNQKFGTWYAKLTRTYEIWSGMGMSIHGVKSCGDYMFSGHTSCITLFNFFITEYTPRKMYFIHTTTWVLNLFGIFFILAAHEHYSIDVFIAFYITSRLFLYYHTLANNRSLMLRDQRRQSIWFPLFSYFESKCYGIVPNEYEWPFRYPKSFVEYFQKKRKRR